MSSIMRLRSGLTVLVSLMESSILSEVDDTSILRTGLPRRYACPLNSLPASRLAPRAAGWSAATLCFGTDRLCQPVRKHFRCWRLTGYAAAAPVLLSLSSRPEDSHLRALPDPYVNLSIHTAPDVRPFPWQSCQWAKSVGFARRSRSNQSRAPLVFRRNRLNLRRAQRMT